MKIPKIFVPEKDLESEVERLLKEEPVRVQSKHAKFEVIRAGTYAEGVAKLKEQGKRPFIFSENVEARIADYEANGEDAELFKTWLDSVTGIAYKAKSTKFKLILRSDKLGNIAKGFNQSFIPVDYDSEKGIELDSKDDKYDQPLTRKEAKDHEFWIAALGGDKKKLAKYVDIWFDKTKAKGGMGVYLRSNIDKDELWALAFYSDYDFSYAYGIDLFYGSARFVSGAQLKKLLSYKRK